MEDSDRLTCDSESEQEAAQKPFANRGLLHLRPAGGGPDGGRCVSGVRR